MQLPNQLQATLGPHYSIERELDAGGMSRLFVAHDRTLNRRVVVKVLAPELARSMLVDRFLREIDTVASLQQANIVPLLSAGNSDGLPFFIMPFVDGQSLADRMDDGPLPVHQVVNILRDIVRGLAYAHAHGIVHRDIKPGNVLLSGGTAILTDFGLAKAIAVAGTATALNTTLGDHDRPLGTPGYMSPEQAAGCGDIDARSDVYSAGCVAYTLLTGHPPFVEPSAVETMASHMTKAPCDLQRLRPDVSPALATLVMRCLAKDRADRPDSAALSLALDSLESHCR